MKHPTFSFLIGLFFLMQVTPDALAANKKQERKVRNALAYLKGVPEIGWFEVSGHNVILGWKGYPANFAHINKTAARNASKKFGGDVHVFSVKAEEKGWRPKDEKTPHICHTTAQRGNVLSSNCH